MEPPFCDEKLDTCLKFISFNKERFRPETEKAVSCVRDVTVPKKVTNNRSHSISSLPR